MRTPLPLNAYEHFEMDENGRLFWKGQLVQLETSFRLQVFERWIAGAAAISAVVVALVEIGRAAAFWV